MLRRLRDNLGCKRGSIRGFQWIERDRRLAGEAAAPARLRVEQLGTRQRNE